MDVGNNSFFSKPVLKTGVVFGVASAVLALLGAIPIIGFFLGVIGTLTTMFAGYTVITVVGGNKERIMETFKSTVVVGLIVGVISGLAGGVAAIISSFLFPRLTILGIYYTPGLAEYIGWFFGALIGGVIFSILWSVVGGIIGVYYPSSKLSGSLKEQMDKLVAFVRK